MSILQQTAGTVEEDIYNDVWPLGNILFSFDKCDVSLQPRNIAPNTTIMSNEQLQSTVSAAESSITNVFTSSQNCSFKISST